MTGRDSLGHGETISAPFYAEDNAVWTCPACGKEIVFGHFEAPTDAAWMINNRCACGVTSSILGHLTPAAPPPQHRWILGEDNG